MTTQTIKLTDKTVNYKANSARALWLGAVRDFSGKAPEEFVEAATQKPPVLKKDGSAEHPAGWLRYFVKEGIVVLAKADAPPAETPTDATAAPAKKTKKKK